MRPLEPGLPPAARENLANNLVLLGCSILFCAVPCFLIAYRLTRKMGLLRGRVYMMGGGVGTCLIVTLMYWLGGEGALFAFTGVIGWFYGAWFAGQHNRYRRRRQRKSPGETSKP